jgi:hypothetical protein
MSKNIVINYLFLNNVYVVIATIFIILFLILNFYLFINFEIELSKSLNTNCENPIAIYFDKGNRDRCLTEKITRKNETLTVDKTFQNKKFNLNSYIATLNQKITDAKNYYNYVINLVSPEINILNGKIPELNELNSYINSTFENSSSVITNMNAEFENTINSNIQLAIDVGNNLVDSLIQMTYTPKVKDKRKKMVDSYEKIKTYLNDATIKPYLDKIKDSSDNPAKIQKIKTDLPKKTKDGPGK